MKTALRLHFSLFVAMTSAATFADAQTIKHGLWEITHKMGGNPKMDEAMAKMEKQMASMPAEQRKMMQDMLAKNGVAMGSPAAGGGTVVKVCISKEMAEKQHLPSQTRGDCTTAIVEKTASSMKMTFACKNPPSSGEGTYTFVSDSAYTMKMKITQDAKGKEESMTMDANGKWLSADCGAIKPVAMPSK